MKLTFVCLIVYILLVSICEAQMTQSDSTVILEPIGEEGYLALVQFLDYDKNLPLNVRTVSKEDQETHTREKIVFTGIRNSRVPGYLAIPKVHAGPCPVVLLLHGLSGEKDNWWQDDNFVHGGLVTKGLLSKGFAVMALDAQYHGERIADNDFETPFNILTSGQMVKFRELFYQTVIDYRMAMDYLATRAEIDMSSIGVLGYSKGGSETFILMAVDPRIKVGVSCVGSPFGLTRVQRFIDRDMTIDQFQVLAKSLRYRTSWSSFQNYAHAIGARPFLMMMGNKDEAYTVREVQQLFELIPSPTKELVIYDSGHSLPPEYTAKAVEWLEAYLK